MGGYCSLGRWGGGAWLTFYLNNNVEQARLEQETERAKLRLMNRKAAMPYSFPSNEQVYFPVINELTGIVVDGIAGHLPSGGLVSAVPSEQIRDEWLAFHKLQSTTQNPALKIGDITINGGVNIATIGLPEMLPYNQIPQSNSIENICFGLLSAPDGRQAPFTMSMREMEHLLVSAKTRWGKSNLLAVVIAQILKARESVQIMALDKQNHGLSFLNGHSDVWNKQVLVSGADMKDGLAWLHSEAQRRGKLMGGCPEAADIWDFNAMGNEYLPPVLVVVDEAASLLDDKGLNKEYGIGESLRRGTFEYGKYGIYQVLGLTSTNADIIPTSHRSQFSTRISFNGGSTNPQSYIVNCDSEQLKELVNAPKGRAIIDCAPLPMPAFIQTPMLPRSELWQVLGEQQGVTKRLSETIAPPLMPPNLTDVERNVFEAIVYHRGASYNEIANIAGLTGSKPTNNGLIKTVIDKAELYDCKIGGKTFGK